jgi:hypothetical protein
MEMLKEGILGIGETDETENEEGSEIELTAYNPDFDEPQLTDEEKLQIESEEETPRIDLFSSAPLNELTDGVTTLFMKKGGQAIGGGTIKGEPRGDRTGFRNPHGGGGQYGGSTSGGTTGGGNDRPTMADIAGPTTTTPTTAPDTGGHSRFEPGSGYYGETVTTTTSNDGDNYKDPILDMVLTPHQKITKHNEILDKHAHRFKSIKDLTWEQRGRLAKDTWRDYNTATNILGIFSGPVGFITGAKAISDAKKQKEETINDLKTDIKTLTDLGYPTHHPTVDTLTQSLEQEILDMTQPRSKDEDTGGDGPEAPVVAPVTEEIEDSYAQATGFLQGYRDLKARQALSAQLQQKWADEREWQQNTMFANRGGLANLFRVKN